jgi:drug/metabolite transporter (DMT)-like permease
MQISSARVAVLAVIMGAIFLGTAPIFFRLGEAGPTAIAFWRVALSLPFTYLWMRLESSESTSIRNRVSNLSNSSFLVFPNKLPQIVIVILAGLFWVGDLVSWHWSLSATNVANSTFFATSSPIFVTVMAWLFLGERYQRLFFAGALFTLLGSATLMSASIVYGNGTILGDGLGLITALCFGSYVLLVRSLRSRMGAGAIMFWTGLISTPFFLIISILSNELLFPQSMGGWFALLGLALITHLAGQGLLAYGLGKVQAGPASILVLLEPLMAAALGWLILFESLNVLQIVGGVMILGGIILIRNRTT